MTAICWIGRRSRTVCYSRRGNPMRRRRSPFDSGFRHVGSAVESITVCNSRRCSGSVANTERSADQKRLAVPLLQRLADPFHASAEFTLSLPQSRKIPPRWILQTGTFGCRPIRCENGVGGTCLPHQPMIFAAGHTLVEPTEATQRGGARYEAMITERHVQPTRAAALAWRPGGSRRRS